jgi:hypothetical protein
MILPENSDTIVSSFGATCVGNTLKIERTERIAPMILLSLDKSDP